MNDRELTPFEQQCVEVLLIIQQRWPGRVFSSREEVEEAVWFATHVGGNSGPSSPVQGHDQ